MCLVAQIMGQAAPAQAAVGTPAAVRAATSTAAAPPRAKGAAPLVSAVSPATVRVGGTVTVTGSNFSPNRADDVVRIGALQATVLSASPTQLNVAAPPGAGGAVQVSTRWGHAAGQTVTIAGATNGSGAGISSRSNTGSTSSPGSTFGVGGNQHITAHRSTPLQAAANVTALSGQVETAAGAPLAGVQLKLTDKQAHAITTTTGADGRFLLQNATAGTSTLRIDGTQTTGGDYGVYQEPVELPAGKTTVMPWTTYLTKIDLSTTVSLPSPTTASVTLTTPKIPGLQIVIPAGTVFTSSTGQVVTQLSLTALPTSRTPMPWGPNMVPAYFTIQPGDARITGPGVQVIYPNGTGLPVGAKVPYIAETPGWPGTGWWQYGTGHVTADGKSIAPDPGTVYHSTGPGGYTLSGGPGSGPNPGDNCPCGDPVDLHTGLLTDSTTDINLPDVQGVNFTRVFRQNDDNVRDFGIGGSDSLNLYIDADAAGNYDLFQPDGGKVVYSPTSTTGVYDAQATPTQYAGSVLTMANSDIDGPFTLVLKNGTTMQYGNPAFLTSITDRFGNTLTINRNEFADAAYGGGQINSVVTSDGRWLKFTYGACVSGATVQCISKIADNSGRTVTYAYDASGRLTTITNPGGGVTTNSWAACTSTLTCTQLNYKIDPTGRKTNYTYNATTGAVTKETLPNGGVWTFQYGTDSAGNAQTIATNPVNDQTATSFNTAGNPITSVDGYGTSSARTTTTAYWNGTGLPSSVTDPLGRVTTTTYDALGNTLTVTKLAGTAQAATTTYTYDTKYSRVTSVTDPLGHISTTAYNDTAHTATTVNAAGASSVTRLNNEGQVVAATDAGGHTTYYSYYLGDLVSTADPTGNVVSAYYDAIGRPVDITDAKGNDTLYTYDAFDDRLTETDPLGHVTTWAYNADHETTTVTDPGGGVTSFGHDGIGDVTKQTNPVGSVSTWTFNANGKPLTATDPDGSVTTYTYDTFGDQLSKTLSYRSYTSKTLYAYDAAGRRYCEVDPLEAAKSVACPTAPPSPSSPPANATSTFYNGLGQVVQVTDPTGATTQTEYDVAGEKICTVGPLEHAKGVTCPASFTLTTSADPAVGASLTAYDALGNPTIEYNPLGGLTTFQYNAVGKVAAQAVSSNDATNAPTVTTAYTYDADNRVATSTVGTGATASVTKLAYDPDGQVYCAVSPSANAAGQSCPAWKAAWGTTPPNPQSLYGSTSTTKVATSFRDPDGRVIQSSTADGATTAVAYSPAGNVYCEADPVSLNPWLALAANASASYPYVCPATAPTTAPAAGSNPGYKTFLYDAAEEVLSSTDALGNTTTSTYDPAGKVLTQTAPGGGVTTYCYYRQTSTCAASSPATGGAAAMPYSQTLPASTADPSGQVTTYTYLPGGQVGTKTTPAGTQTLAYDADGRTTSSSYSTAPTGHTQTAAASLTYWPDSSPKTVTDGTGTTNYTDDAIGDPLSVAFTPGTGSTASAYTVGYSWFTNGQQASITYPNIGTLTAGAVSYAYNTSGEESSLKDWNGHTTTFGYNGDGRVTSTALPNGVTNTAAYNLADVTTSITASTTSGTLLGITYTPTSSGLIGAETDTGASTASTAFTFDNAGRIVTSGSSTQTYNGDNDPTTVGAQTQTFNTADQLTGSSSGGQTTSYAYDTIGDRVGQTPSTGTATTYGYDQAGRLTSTSAPTATTFTYGATGLRATATTSSGTSTFVYDISRSLPHLLTDGTNDYVYGPDGNLVEQVGASTTSYATTDVQNTPRLLTSSTGAVVGSFTYGTTGTPSTQTGTVTTPIGYAGGYTTPGSSLVYFLNRYYDPATEQFLSVDPSLTATATPYNYAGDNPVNNADPTGLSWLSSLACNLGNAIANNWQAIAIGIGVAAAVALAATGIGLLAEAGLAAVAEGGLGLAAADGLGLAGTELGVDGLGAAALDGSAGGLGTAGLDGLGVAGSDAAGTALTDGLGTVASDTAGAGELDGLGASVDAATDAAGSQGAGGTAAEIEASGQAGAALPADLASTFTNGTYSQVTTEAPTTLYRVFGGDAGQLSAWWSRTLPASSAEAVDSLALNPVWGNTATQWVSIEVPAGTTFFEGTAAAQAGLSGGGSQVLFYNTQVLTEWITGGGLLP